MGTKFIIKKKNLIGFFRGIVQSFIKNISLLVLILLSSSLFFISLDSANGQYLHVTGEHPFYSYTTEDWVKVKDLNLGDKLLTSKGEVAVIKNIERAVADESFKVYNMQVGNVNDYYAGEVLVHNKGGKAKENFEPVINVIRDSGDVIKDIRDSVYPEDLVPIDKFPKLEPYLSLLDKEFESPLYSHYYEDGYFIIKSYGRLILKAKEIVIVNYKANIPKHKANYYLIYRDPVTGEVRIFDHYLTSEKRSVPYNVECPSRKQGLFDMNSLYTEKDLEGVDHGNFDYWFNQFKRIYPNYDQVVENGKLKIYLNGKLVLETEECVFDFGYVMYRDSEGNLKIFSYSENKITDYNPKFEKVRNAKIKLIIKHYPPSSLKTSNQYSTAEGKVEIEHFNQGLKQKYGSRYDLKLVETDKEFILEIYDSEKGGLIIRTSEFLLLCDDFLIYRSATDNVRILDFARGRTIISNRK